MMKRVAWAFAASCLFPLAALTVLMLRLGEPHTRSVAVGLYLIGCLCLGLAIAAHTGLRRRLAHAKFHAFFALEQLGLLKKRALAAVAFFALCLVLFPIVFPWKNTGFLQEDMTSLASKLSLTETRLEQSETGLLSASNDLALVLGDFRLSDGARRQALKEAWAGYLDHALVLEQIIFAQKHFAQLALRSPELANRAFLAGYQALVIQVQLGNQLNQKVRNRSHIEALLNERTPELGLPADTYLAFKKGLTRAETLLRLELGYAQLKLLRKWGKFDHQQQKASRIENSAAATIRALSHNPGLLIDAGFDRFEHHAFTAWFPLQKGTAELISPVRTTHRKNFVRNEDLKWAQQKLEPGDILLERRNWYLTNMGIPGFWPHAALYVGTPDELDKFFAPEDRAATDGMPPSRYLQIHLPDVYAAYGRLDEEGHSPRVLEAIGEGVVLQSLETSGQADYLAALRPRLAAKRKLAAIVEAYRQFGKAYDYNFDFSTDDTLFCSELVYKALSRSGDEPGLSLPLLRQNGRYMLPPNDIARVFDEQWGTAQQQLDFVFFLDGNEAKARATFNDRAAFQNSWTRPKWDIMQP